MRVFHGTTPDLAQKFVREGIDAHLAYPRAINGPQVHVPGIFVTPKLSVARRFGLCVLSIEVLEAQLGVPPNLALAGATLGESLTHHFEPQAFVSGRIEPSAISIVECYEAGYPFNPFDRDD